MFTRLPVRLVDYDPEWPGMAASLAQQLRVLGGLLIDVHHIGSTSVPGLVAKPVIDLMPVVTDLVGLDDACDQVKALGYDWRGEYGIAGRRYCTRSREGGHRIAHVHFFQVGAADVARHLAFRDYLRTHPEVADAYAAEKRRARDLHPEDMHAYSDEKSAWIRATEARALLWFSGRPV